MPTAVNHQNKKYDGGPLKLWKLHCWWLVLMGGSHAGTLEAGEPIRFSEHLLANEHRYTFGLGVVDIDGDGDLDVVMAHGMRTTIDPEVERHEVVWYENVGQPKSGRTWKRCLVGRLPFAFEAIGKDLDGDNDVDVIATAWANTPRLSGKRPTKSGGDRVVWFENRGGNQWAIHDLSTSFPQANQVIAADLNGDGRPDIVASCDGS